VNRPEQIARGLRDLVADDTLSADERKRRARLLLHDLDPDELGRVEALVRDDLERVRNDLERVRNDLAKRKKKRPAVPRNRPFRVAGLLLMRQDYLDDADPGRKTHYVLWVMRQAPPWRQVSEGARADMWEVLFSYLDEHPDHPRPAWLAVIPCGVSRPEPPRPGRDGRVPLPHGWVYLPEGGEPVVVPPPSLRRRG
jgi:hypothetical protein